MEKDVFKIYGNVDEEELILNHTYDSLLNLLQLQVMKKIMKFMKF